MARVLPGRNARVHIFRVELPPAAPPAPPRARRRPHLRAPRPAALPCIHGPASCEAAGTMLPVVLLAALAASPIVPAPPPPAGAAVVSGVEVEGVRRTSAAFVRSALGVAPGDRFDPAAIPALEQRLLNRRIFRSVRITPEPGEAGVLLRVAVAEKLTLFPVPFVAASRG